ncbi:MAG TPA: NAD(P)-dependent oxidoreductase [Planctomycetota bacterium]|nr:NAD(P)-dependent oxidoreductase [Planctomycetota bacterium]
MPLTFTSQFEGSALLLALPHRVLITGANGAIGAYFAQHAAKRYDLRLMIRPGSAAADLATHGEVVEAELGDLVALHRACTGMDTVVHLAGMADPSAVWRDVLADNIVGAYHLFTAAKAAGCRRVVYASSIHAVSGYPADVQVKPTDPVNPGDFYGVSKCFAEVFGRYFAEQEGLSVIAVRIGACLPVTAVTDDQASGVMDTFIAQDDLVELFQRAIDDRTLQWALLHGLSDNRFKRLDISTTRDLVRYVPAHDVFRLQPCLQALEAHRRVLAHNVGDARQLSGLRDELRALDNSRRASPPA